jgi:hypothetical protein
MKSTSNREEWICIGEGDDVISGDDWGAPVATYTDLLSLHVDCESFAVDLPLDELSAYLEANGDSPTFDQSAFDSTEEFLAQLLGSFARLEHERWDAGQPGGSGVVVRFYIDQRAISQIRSILDRAEEYVRSWKEASGLAETISSYQSAKQFEVEERLVAADAEKVDADARRQADAEAWEQQLLQDVLSAAQDENAGPYVRLNFLVANRTVFFIDSGWWHSLKGDPRNVARSLEQNGLKIVRCKVLGTQKGWVPYFARTVPEQNGFGWDDESISLEATPIEFNPAMVSAWETHRGRPKC